MASSTALEAYLRAIDRPAGEAARLARRPVWVTLAALAAGLGQVALALAATRTLLPDAAHGPHLRKLVESLVLIVPGTVVLSTYARLRITPRLVLGACALGALTGGIAALAMVPLCALLVLVARGGPVELICMLLPAVMGLLSIAVVSTRVVRALDPRPVARYLSLLFAAALVAVFAGRHLS